MKTKIKFTDIVGMLERDEMREITGACGSACETGSGTGSGAGYFTGAGDFSTGLATFASMGFGGGTAIGSSFGGQTYSGYNSFNSSPTNNNYSSNSYSSNNYSSGWSSGVNGLTTNDPKAISRYFDFVIANNGVVTNAQTNDFIRNEATVTGQQANNVAYAIQLKEVVIQNNYHGPSTIPQGIVINNNGTIQFYNSNNSGTSGTGNTNNSPTWLGMPIHGSAVKPTTLEAAYMAKDVYGGESKVDPKNLGGWVASKAITGVAYNDPNSGFKSQLYEKTMANGEKQYCYVTAGTENGKDWAANTLQITGISLQYQESVNNAIALKKLFGDSLSFAGHSLGGGMAEANARATGESATTFNAAGLSPATALFLGIGIISDTNAYIMKSDPLNILQTATPIVPTAGGQIHFLDCASSEAVINGHSIDYVIESLQKNP